MKMIYSFFKTLNKNNDDSFIDKSNKIKIYMNEMGVFK